MIKFKNILEGKRSDKAYGKEVLKYKYFIVDISKKKAESGWEYLEDAKDALSDYDGDKNFKIMSEKSLSSAGIDNPKQKWASGVFESIINKKLNESVGQDIFTIKKYKYSDNEPVHYRIFSDGGSVPSMSFEIPLKSVQAFEAKLLPELKKSILFIKRQ